jgi:hypothetical protein
VDVTESHIERPKKTPRVVFGEKETAHDKDAGNSQPAKSFARPMPNVRHTISNYMKTILAMPSRMIYKFSVTAVIKEF